MPALIEDARAKVNLTLRVMGRRVDGLHELESVVAFADCEDRLGLVPGKQLHLAITGPQAHACGETDDNLVLTAARLLAERVPNLQLGEFTLDKRLPVAAGIGGGSADESRYPLALAAASVGLIVVSYFCYNALGSDLLPEMDEGAIVFDYLMPAGSSLADTNTVLMGVEKILAKVPEIESMSRRTGLQLGLAAVTEANTNRAEVAFQSASHQQKSWK